MPLVQQIRIDTPSSSRKTHVPISQKSLREKAKARRRWIIRSALTLTLTAVLLWGLVIWRRDKSTVDINLRKVNDSVAVLQERVTNLGMLPASAPELNDLTYASYSERYYAKQSSEPVIIAFTKEIPLILRKSGRCVVFYDQGKLNTKWMSVSDFQLTWRKQEDKMRAFDQKRFSEKPDIP